MSEKEQIQVLAQVSIRYDIGDIVVLNPEHAIFET